MLCNFEYIFTMVSRSKPATVLICNMQLKKNIMYNIEVLEYFVWYLILL